MSLHISLEAFAERKSINRPRVGVSMPGASRSARASGSRDLRRRNPAASTGRHTHGLGRTAAALVPTIDNMCSKLLLEFRPRINGYYRKFAQNNAELGNKGMRDGGHVGNQLRSLDYDQMCGDEGCPVRAVLELIKTTASSQLKSRAREDQSSSRSLRRHRRSKSSP